MQTETPFDIAHPGLHPLPHSLYPSSTPYSPPALHPSTQFRLKTLTDWSTAHIRAVFEAASDAAALRAIEDTFAERLEGSVNGAPLSRPHLAQMVLAMRQSAGPRGLRVEWVQAQEVPGDATLRDGSLGGMYVIRGIQRATPSGHPALFERHKTVAVRIESELLDPRIDSRRITSLVFVASDVRVNRQTAL
ncbi:hypothetical protein BD626DRAFT_568082 [Schizophyllum amplum]|uniref:Uncharacterized protein n=1 Tax=Schizophyllum amplum TaxID=97359 RepID=A0A550CHS8_9AGAR|nr:hypothetical protein BD626DRAFT_568082 [Auriculariopsis ampla]